LTQLVGMLVLLLPALGGRDDHVNVGGLLDCAKLQWSTLAKPPHLKTLRTSQRVWPKGRPAILPLMSPRQRLLVIALCQDRAHY